MIFIKHSQKIVISQKVIFKVIFMKRKYLMIFGHVNNIFFFLYYLTSQ